MPIKSSWSLTYIPTVRTHPLQRLNGIKYLTETAPDRLPQMLHGSITLPNIAMNLPSQTGYKVFYFSHVEVTTACQTWDSGQRFTSFSWQIDYIWPLTTPLGYSSTSPLLTPVQATVLLFQSDQLTPATPLWPLKQICLMFVSLWTIWSLTMVPFLSQKLTRNGLRVEVFGEPSTRPTVQKQLVPLSIEMAFSKIDSKRFLTLSLSPSPGQHILVRTFGY